MALLYGIPFLTHFKCIWRPCLQKSAKRNCNKFLKIYSTRGGKARVHADIKSVEEISKTISQRKGAPKNMKSGKLLEYRFLVV